LRLHLVTELEVDAL